MSLARAAGLLLVPLVFIGCSGAPQVGPEQVAPAGPTPQIQLVRGPPPRIVVGDSSWVAPQAAGTLLVEPDRRVALHATLFPRRAGVSELVSDRRVLEDVPRSLDVQFLHLPELEEGLKLTLELAADCDASLALYGEEAMFVVGYGGSCQRVDAYPLGAGTPWQFEGKWTSLDPLVLIVDGAPVTVDDVRQGPPG